ELVLGEDLAVGHRVQESALTGVGVTDDRDRRDAALVAAGSALSALFRELFEATIEARDALVRTAPADLELRFAWSAAPDAPREPREGVVALSEARQEVFHLRQLDLELAVRALG